MLVFSITLTVCFLELALTLFPPRLALQRDQLWDHINGNQPEDVDGFVSSYEYDTQIGYIRPSAVEQVHTMSEKPGETVLVLGDSVSELGQFPALLQDLLNSSDSATPISVFNAGTIGYSTKMETDFYEKFAIDTNPSLVILQMHPNDIGGTPVILPTKDSWIAFSPNSKMSYVQLPILKDSKLYRLLVVLFLERMKSSNDTAQFKSEMRAALRDLSHQLAQQNVPLVIFIEPAYYAFDPGDYTYENVKKIVVEAGLSDHLVEMKEPFDAIGPEKLMLKADHPNLDGHTVIAQTLFPRVKLLLER